MREQVAFVKEIRHLTQQGNFTRLCSPFEGNLAAWEFADDKKEEILVCMFRRYAQANSENVLFRLRDVDETRWYTDQDGRMYHGSVLRHVGLCPVFQGPNARRMEDAASQVLYLRAK